MREEFLVVSRARAQSVSQSALGYFEATEGWPRISIDREWNQRKSNPLDLETVDWRALQAKRYYLQPLSPSFVISVSLVCWFVGR